MVDPLRLLGHRDAAPPAEHVDVEQRVRAQAVGTVHRDARALAGRVQAGHRRVGLVGDHLSVDGRRDAPHRVVGRRLDRHAFLQRLDAEVDPCELGDVGELLLDHLRVEVVDVQQHVVLLRPQPATLADLDEDRARDHVARREVLDGRRVTLHEPLALGVAEDPAFASSGLGQQDADPVDAGGVELEELHVLEREAAPQHDRRAVPGQRVRVGGDPEHPPVAAGREQHGLGAEDVQLAGRQLVGHEPATRSSAIRRSRT